MINVFQPALGTNELLAIEAVMQSNWIGRGEKVKQFERDFARTIGVDPENVVSTTSCTEALFQIMEFLVVKDYEVIVPAIHFIGAANAVLSQGGKLVLCDVDKESLNARVEDIEPLITDRTIAVILLHYGGNRANTLTKLAQKHGFFVVEDCACNPTKHPTGDFAVWSFDAMKIISTGDGGMIYARDPYFIKDLRNLMHLGLDNISGFLSQEGEWWSIRSEYPGRRAIMNDITAAIGIEQLKRLPEFMDKRRALRVRYRKHLPQVQTSPYFAWIQTERRTELAHYLKDNSIYTTFRYYPLHWALQTGDSLPNAEWAARHTLNLPLHQSLSLGEVDYICEKVKEFLHK